MGIVVPSWVIENMEKERLVADTDRAIGAVREWNRLLSELDDGRLKIVWGLENAVADGRVLPGRWHVRRRNDPPMPDSYKPIITADGGYREFESSDLDRLRSQDFRNPQVAEWYFGTGDRMRKAREDQDAADSAERIDAVATAVKVADSPGVSMSDTKWRARKERS